MANQTGISFNPRGPLPSPTVKSRLVTPRELGASWRNERAALVRGFLNTNYQGQLQRQMNQLTPFGQSGTFWHPFKIYQFPSSLRRFTNDNDFQRYKVRAGNWNAGLTLYGADNISIDNAIYSLNGDVYLDPYNSQDLDFSNDLVTPFPDTGTWNEALIPNPDIGDPYPGLYWFWISLTASAITGQGVTGGYGTVCYGAGQPGVTPLSAVDLYSGTQFTENWATFPVSDPYHILIGAVNFSSPSNVFIEQQITADISMPFDLDGASAGEMASCVPRYRGDYDGATFYFYADSISQTTLVGGNTVLSQYIYYPPSGSAYPFWNGPITAIDPSTNSPDPWKLISQSFIDASYVNGAYDGSKYYLRTA